MVLSMKILSWNVSRKSNSCPLKDVLKEEIYDVICLQEVNEVFITELKSNLYNYTIYTAKEVLETKKSTHELFLVTLIKSEVINTASFSHEAYNSRFYHITKRRISIEYSYVDFSINGTFCRIFNCHLQCVASPSFRLAQFKGILKEFENNYHNIICGDLNTFYKPYLFMIGPALNYKKTDYFINEKKIFSTFESLKNPLYNKNTSIYKTGQLDYILVPKYARVNAAHVLKSLRYTSDHYPICTDILLERNENKLAQTHNKPIKVVQNGLF